MHPLNRKLLRDLWRLRGQVLAVALVIASGVGVMVMSLTALEALEQTAEAYYERYRFAHVFAQVRRAPEGLAGQIARLPGVQSVQTRVVKTAVLDVRGFDEPLMGQLVSIPTDHPAALNRLALREGRLPSADAPDEVVLGEPFAEAHGLHPGDSLRAIVNGRWRVLSVVGVALSPEFVYLIAPGALMPDEARYGVLWMGHEALQAAWDLDGAFNDICVRVMRGTDVRALVDRMDLLLASYGGVGAFDRSEQTSNWFLMNELEQLAAVSTILPMIFLAVAAFLANMVLARLVAVERSEIGLLKAFGYGNLSIGLHYVKLVLGIALLGCVIGSLLGYLLGHYNTNAYTEFFRFPFLVYSPGPRSFAVASLVSLLAALLGTLGAVRRAVRLPPAEAMRAPAPARFERSRLAAWRVVRALDQPTRIILRQIGRWPLRSLLTSAGIAMSVAVLVLSLQWLDAIDHLVEVYFKRAQSQDVTIGFDQALSASVIQAAARLPGVMSVEPMRTVAARLRNGHHGKREPIQGLGARQQLFKVYDVQGGDASERAIELPPDGLVMSSMLAARLEVAVGDRVEVQFLEGRRARVQVPVVRVFETYIGTPVYMRLAALDRLMGESARVNALHLRVDANAMSALYRALKQLPSVVSVSIRELAVRKFYETLARTIYIYTAFFVAFACVLAIGVTYNAARIALSERGRELATLRVIGFSRAEISYILLGEVALLTLLAMPLGAASGYLLARLMVDGFATELYRVPVHIEAATYGWSILVALLATTGSALLVRRRLDRLDLIAVLKTRE
ncbi:MAG: ABC transporter permease [Gammaproteobacteria bacterium]|nr:ABC transporter permease [Gammaproteobacteria bacterium]